MASYIGKIDSLDGTFYAKSADGSLRELSIGDKLYEGEIIVGDDGNSAINSIIVSMNDGNDIIVLGTQTQALDASLTQEEFAENETVTETSSIQSMLEKNGDIDSDNIEDLQTAAGEETGGAESTDGIHANFAESNDASADVNANVGGSAFTSEENIDTHKVDESEESRRVEGSVDEILESVTDTEIASMVGNVADLTDAANEAATAADAAAAAA
ncbi:cell shape-determining protein MreD, partial [bacterium]|nr:cell shape-determining protein MreD [bacterium]MBU1990874.1 cell shape-determining protein MreD [bacterium]